MFLTVHVIDVSEPSEPHYFRRIVVMTLKKFLEILRSSIHFQHISRAGGPTSSINATSGMGRLFVVGGKLVDRAGSRRKCSRLGKEKALEWHLGGEREEVFKACV